MFVIIISKSKGSKVNLQRKMSDMRKKITVATVAKRMNRILSAYREQQLENCTSSDASTSSASPALSPSDTRSRSIYTTERGLVQHKTILNYATHTDNESDISDQSYSLLESPPKLRSRRRRQPFSLDESPAKRCRRTQPFRIAKSAATKSTARKTGRRLRPTMGGIMLPHDEPLDFLSQHLMPMPSDYSDSDSDDLDDISNAKLTGVTKSTGVAKSTGVTKSTGDTKSTGTIKPTSIIIKTTSKATRIQPM